MKTNWLIILMIAFSYTPTLPAQEIVDESNRWNIDTHTMLGGPITRTDRLVGDTILDGKLYKRLYESRDSANVEWNQSNIYMRSEGNQVYLKYYKDQEFLIYDFDLQVTDTFRMFIPGQDYTQLLQVMSIDSVQINNGDIRKRIFFTDTADTHPHFWIEGIGSNFGLTNNYNNYVLDYAEFLICFYYDTEMLYPKDPETCWHSVSSIGIEDYNIELFPNPVSDILYFNQENDVFKHFSIRSITGKVELDGHLDLRSSLDVSGITPGLYLVTLRSKEGKIRTEKIIIE